MPIHNADIAAIFEEIADLLETESAKMFRVQNTRPLKELRSLLECMM
jgi:DNA polymerase (family X)